MPDVYEGDSPYIFVSYAHADDDAVLPLLEALVAEGYRVWWDKGIELAMPFPDYIARHVYRCACFVPLLSRASLESPWCCKEIEFANRYRKQILPVFIEDVELPLGLDFQIGSLQSLYRFSFVTDDAFYAELFRAKVIGPCLTAEGARRRGAKARGTQPESTVAKATAQVQIVEPLAGQARIAQTNAVDGVVPRASLVDYSWVELKELSRMIAAARSDAEGLGIAKEYNLVDKDGRLQGDAKEVVLGDKGKTKASVRILGFRHDELAGGGRAGISFEFADVPETQRMNPADTNAGGWQGSEMRRWLNSSFLGLLPGDLRAGVAAAWKRTNNRGLVAENDIACVTTTADRLWLLSAYEVYGGVPSWMHSPATYAEEGSKYRLYADKGVAVENYASCKKRGADSWWWLRSPTAYGSNRFHGVGGDGGWRWGSADGFWGVSPGFCL